MNDDQLRDRIGRLDPLAHSELGGVSIDPITSPEARSRLETIMNSTLSELETSDPQPNSPQPRNPRRWMAISGAAAAAVAAIAIGVVAVNSGGDDEPQDAGQIETTNDQQDPGKLTVLDLSTGEAGAIAGMCIQLDPTIIAQSQVAFKGTVTMADNGVVQLTVDDAYVGVDAQVVTLSAPDGQLGLNGSVDWVVGGEYLVTAWDGVVNYCGQTGPATPELQAMFNEAFGR
jgi:hypothetical protein